MELGRFEMCLNVRDPAASRAFYETLGFAAVGGSSSDAYLIVRNEAVSVGLYQGHIGENLLNFRGGDVFAIAAALEAAGLTLETPVEVEPDGTHGATLRDPDGNLIYFNTP